MLHQPEQLVWRGAGHRSLKSHLAQPKHSKELKFLRALELVETIVNISCQAAARSRRANGPAAGLAQGKHRSWVRASRLGCSSHSG